MQKETEINEFLRESNAIEGVYDEVSLFQARIAWQYLMEQNEMTVGVVKKTHKILMLHQNLMPNEKGYFRQVNVRVGNHQVLPASVVDIYMNRWVEDMNKAKPPIESVALHIEYERIHPFVDGNGRTGRMFMNWCRIKITKQPILIIKESEKQEYYNLFR